ncbi:MAG: polysaccharide deacetylase family protein, partial [Burkholderiales bacterium]
EIAAAQGEIERTTGIRPRFFRAPFGVRNPFLDPVLHDLDLQYVSWTRRGFDTIEPDPEKVTARLTRHLAAGDILVLHDGRAQQRGLASPNRRADTLAVTARLLEAIASARLRAVTLRGAFA